MPTPNEPTDDRIKVAILGGGCGAMTAAFELTATPELRSKYSVTVYQQGWRLGGKGAAGRNVEPELGKRIQEHGLHMWMGFYENAFEVIERVYAEWGNTTYPTWDKAFTKETRVTLMQKEQRRGQTVYTPWPLHLDFWPGTPGKPLTPLDLVHEFTKLLLEHHERHPRTGKGTDGHAALLRVQDTIAASRKATVDLAQLSSELHSHLEHAHMSVRGATNPRSGCLGFLRRVERDVERLFLMINLGWAIFKGLVVDVLPQGPPGYGSIDHLDFRAWLHKHGAHPDYVDSAPVRTFYDLGFAYEDGDVNKPSAAAGVVLRVLLGIMFGTRGSPLWRMNFGMGDTIFTPLYEVLAKRGVRFEFFHRVENLGVSGTNIETITVSQQVETLAGYRLFTTASGVPDFPCWPAEPDWDHIENGTTIKAALDAQGVTLESHWCDQEVASHTLTRGDDFDLVVLGISIAGFPLICDELIEANDDWRRMVRGLKTVRTQALQMWMTPELRELGWDAEPMVMTTYAENLSTWAVMSDLISREGWPPGQEPGSLHYFCGPLLDPDPSDPFPKDPAFPKRMHAQVKSSAIAWLGDHIGPLWPRALDANGTQLNWSLLYDRSGGNGIDRFDSQYWRANIDPSERYVLSVPDSVQHRLDPGGSGFDNLYLAGDWTRTRLNAGSVEAAVESGKRCAQAISGSPKTILGEHSMT